MTVIDTTEPKPKFNLPSWAVGLIVAVALAGAGWLVWWYVFGGPGPRERSVVIENPGNARLDGRIRTGNVNMVPRRPPGAVQPNRDGSWNVAAGQYQLAVMKRSGANDYRFELIDPSYSAVDKADLPLLRIRRDLINLPVPKGIDVKPDQIAALRKISSLGGMVVSDADSTLLKNAWNEYMFAKDDAAKQAADKKLPPLVTEIAGRSVAATKARAGDLAKQVTAILSKEQIDKLKTRVGP